MIVSADDFGRTMEAMEKVGMVSKVTRFFWKKAREG
mgnify:CR=1 FL=1